MKEAIFLWIVIVGSSEDHWHRHRMPDEASCFKAVKEVHSIMANSHKQNAVVMYCAGEKQVQFTDRTWKP